MQLIILILILIIKLELSFIQPLQIFLFRKVSHFKNRKKCNLFKLYTPN